MLEKGGWFLPIHYGSDTWVTYWAAKNQYLIKWCYTYKMIHHLAPEGRVRYREDSDIPELIRAMNAAGYVPPLWMLSAQRRGVELT
jgi:hypothetical protein